MNENLHKIAEQLVQVLQERKIVLATAESCTGGLVSEIITSFPDVSSCFERGFVVYSNLSKIEMLGVSAETLEQFGAVSENTAAEMASGAIFHSKASVSLSVTGIAGPSGGTDEKPVGTVCFGWQIVTEKSKTKTWLFEGDRNQIRLQAAEFSLQNLYNLLCTK